MQFNCSASIKEIIQNQLIEKTFNFFVAYPLNISNEKTQLNFFNDIFNQRNLTLNMSFNIKDVNEIMNNYNMFENLYFYNGIISYNIIDLLTYSILFYFTLKFRIKKFLWLYFRLLLACS